MARRLLLQSASSSALALERLWLRALAISQLSSGRSAQLQQFPSSPRIVAGQASVAAMISALAFPAPHNPESYYDALQRRPDFLWLKTIDGEDIPACHIRNQSRGSAPRYTLLYSHGNAEDLAEACEYGYLDSLSQATGADVFAYEYVGYSLSRLRHASASEDGCIRSVDAAWRYCTETARIPPKHIVMFGRSIGSGPTVDLASRGEVPNCRFSPLDAAGVLLQSPIESGARAVLGHVTSWMLYRLDLFRNYEKIDRITAPVAIMHGTADKVVPVQNGESLHKSLQRPFKPLWIQGRGHNDMPQTMCFNYAREFLDHLGPPPS